MEEVEKKEKAEAEKVWEKEGYRITSPGYVCLIAFIQHFKDEIIKGGSISDFGCGPGLTAQTFLQLGLQVNLVDIAENCLQDNIYALTLLEKEKLKFTRACLWALPEDFPKTDWIYCADVLEHLPEDKVLPSLEAMAKRTAKGGYLQICTVDDNYSSIIGEELHLTIKPKDWWLQKIEKYWKIDKVVTIIEDFRFSCLVRPFDK